MTILELASRRQGGSALRALISLVLIAGVLLAGCSGLTSAKVVSQGSATASLVKPSNATSTRLANLHGTVEVRTGTGKWTLAKSGQTLKSGQQIRTGALSNVTLAFYDGSEMYLGTEAEITLDALDARTSGARVVQLTQLSGESWHEVAQSDDSGSQYVVNTPTGSGSATGTTFTVMVLPDQLSQFWVESGSVSVVSQDVTVMVPAGHTTSIFTGEPPIEPEFRISGEGQLFQIATAAASSTTLPVLAPTAAKDQKGKITICHATGSATNPYVEITVSVSGAENGHAKHSGDIIPAPADGCFASAPAAVSTVYTSWEIAGETYTSGAGLVVFGSPQPGDWVRFEGRQLIDGSRFVDRIVLLNHSLENQFTFIGPVEAIGDTEWTIAGRVVQVNEFTALESGLKLGDTVQVSGAIAEDGLFWVTRLNRTEGAGSNFRFAGILTDIGSSVWVISGIQVSVDDNTLRYGDFLVGAPVSVEGLVLENGKWLATVINLVTPADYHFEFTGELQNLSPWTVSGVSFDTTEWSEIDAGLKVGNTVRVTGMVSADGVWVAESIELINSEQPTSFAFFGPVLSINPWNVRGVSLLVDERTNIKDEILVGEMVKVSGWILEDGTWLAIEIKHTGLHLGQGCLWVSSVVQSITAEQIILVNGQTIVRTETLIVTGEIQEASVVRYQTCVDAQGVSQVVSITTVYQLETLPQGKAVICHIPPGNPGNQHTIEVGQSAVPAHLGHGDTLGPCSSEKHDKKPKKNT